MSMRSRIRRLLRAAGYDISRYNPGSHPLARRAALMSRYRIDTVLDVGANAGQFARQLRTDIGFKGRILSFEPLASAYEKLDAAARRDPDWDTFNHALGDTDGEQEINISGNSYSSSLLGMLPSLAESVPESRYVGKETIQVHRLDTHFKELCGPKDRVYMKIDTQGFESRVLKGAEEALKRIQCVQMEMSLVPLYEGELLLPEMCLLMRDKGYTLVAIEPGFSDPDRAELLQADGFFHRDQSS